MPKTKYIPIVTTTELLKAGRRYVHPRLSAADIDIDFNGQPSAIVGFYSPNSGNLPTYPNYLNTSEALLKRKTDFPEEPYYSVQPNIIKWDNELESAKPLDEPVFKQNHVNVYPLNIGNQEQINKKDIKYYKDSLGNYVIKRNSQQNIPYDINTYNIPIKKKQ